ncbi:dihydrofolate reductase family protein [Micrococcus sp. FDAARGOS_333]|uniref:dihydrofolate reductase family protein n=1 Tax=Micrococcus sp. FDAARGOS_333 TaxID=1930558 RepID=UPI000B4E2368|nr:dihydrofolate reductase family protein [Micrococcus sp. FDAARGOS_333]PNL16771.1 deaminase [Micrococcus sp. FDAARGOS_333]PNL18782.1 deaminase [Micrococcus sp. FDAARGOS_333]
MKLSINLFRTFDGVSQGPGSAHEDPRDGFTNGGWLMPVFDEGVGEAVNGWFEHCGALLLGRRTYDTFAAHWPQVTDPSDPVAAVINRAPKYVVTSSELATDAWADSTTVLGEDFLERIRELKASDAESELQVHGSVKLARTLHDAGLVDLYRFVVAPVVVGSGSGVFSDAGPATTMSVTHSTVTPNGCLAIEMVPGEFVNDLTAAVEDGQDVIRPAE